MQLTQRQQSLMYNPPHPGSILKEDILPELDMTVTDAAKQLKVTRPALSRVLNEHAAISANMAIKLEQWLDQLGYKGGRAEQWLRMQMAYDLWQVRQRNAVAA